MNKRYEGILYKFLSKDIYLNVGYLEEGNYNLKIVNKDKVICTTRFKK